MFTNEEIEDILSAVDQNLSSLSKSEGSNKEVKDAEGKDLEKMDKGKSIENTGTSTPEGDRNGTVDSVKTGESVAKMGMGMEQNPEENYNSDAPMMGQEDQLGQQPMGEEPAMGEQPGQPGEQDMGDEFGQQAAPDQMGMEEDMMADSELSDEELNEIYGSMDPQELEKHYMIIRQHMQAAYQKAEIAMKNELENKEIEDVKKSEVSEKEAELIAKNEVIEAELSGLKTQLNALTSVIEKSINKPSRKAIVQENELEFVAKSANGVSDGTEDLTKKEFSQDELRNLASDKAKENLTKKERDVINDYFIYGENKNELINLLVGGKK